MKIYGILVLLMITVFVAACATSEPVSTGSEQVQGTQNNEQTQNNEEVITNEPSGISTSELSSHNKQSDCWIAYKGKVYDITEFVPMHPGGASKITPYCGTSGEFEAAFTGQHGTSQVNNMIRQTTYKGDLQ